uniref:MYND-type domain-containing protein n=1 Tax=Graphocephala atropunctata TaxID=36148 RepID=A0A1B6M621_9HEMI
MTVPSVEYSNMEKITNIFYCTVCNVCKSLPKYPEAVKFCSGCRLIQYCSSHHQKIDWHDHKAFCKSIQHILKRTGANHVFQEAFEYTEKNSVRWNNLRMSVLDLVQLILKRPLTTSETQTVLFPPVCNYCYNYKPNQMFTCHSCNSVLYCCREHQTSDNKHSGACESLALAFKIDTAQLSEQLPRLSIPMKNLKPPNALFQDTETFLRQGNVSLSNEEVLLSEQLSYSLTLAFAISKVGKVSRKRITIHIVGADSMEALALNTFPFIFHLTNLIHIQIIMIGPNFPTDIPLPSEIEEKCSLFVIRDNLYHEYVSSDTYVCPDVIVVYNCGFCEFKDVPEKDIWIRSLPFILDQKNCLVILTSYTAEESKEDLDRLCEANNCVNNYSVLLRNEANPFCSLYPLRNWEVGQEAVFYVNKYISVIQT